MSLKYITVKNIQDMCVQVRGWLCLKGPIISLT